MSDAISTAVKPVLAALQAAIAATVAHGDAAPESTAAWSGFETALTLGIEAAAAAINPVAGLAADAIVPPLVNMLAAHVVELAGRVGMQVDAAVTAAAARL